MKSVPTPEGDHVLPAQKAYDAWAEVYENDGNPLTVLEEERARALLGDVRGLSVADVGCGTGRHSVWLAAHGAQVTALDFSAGMLGKARGKPGAEGIHFVQHDLSSPFPLEDESFDRVLSALVVEHILDLKLFFAQMGRICRPQGRVVVSAMHPAMMLLGVHAGFHDPTTGAKTYARSYPNQISDFVMAAKDAGLLIDEMSEHPVDEKLVEIAPRAEKYLGWMLLLMMRFRPAA